MTLEAIEHKEIDSIIDEGRASGLYIIDKINIETQYDENLFDDWSDSYESLCNCSKNISLQNWESSPKLQQCPPQIELNYIPRSDSDVSIIRVKKQSKKLKKQTHNKWESIHDKAVPGDGTHLAESPSLVNLVTFVNYDTNIKRETREYLIPISSWDPINTKRRNSKSITRESSDIQFKEIHRSLHKSEISDSRLNIPYLMKQKLSLRPGALFSKNPTAISFESDNDLQLDNNNKEFQMIKAPPCENICQHQTIKKRLHKFARKVLCACCVFEPVTRKTRYNFEIGVQTMNNNLEL